jgi:hypothetical protein
MVKEAMNHSKPRIFSMTGDTRAAKQHRLTHWVRNVRCAVNFLI